MFNLFTILVSHVSKYKGQLRADGKVIHFVFGRKPKYWTKLNFDLTMAPEQKFRNP